MSIRRNLTSIISSILVAVTFLTGCNIQVNPSNETNSVAYSDYSFWEKQNNVKITLPINMENADEESPFTGIGKLELESKYLERVEKLKEAMISYFNEVYNIDISGKLENQQLRAFVSKDQSENITMGYVDTNEPQYLNLNNELFSNEYKKFFDNTYIHETLHQIGFRSEDSIMITEGIVDALTDLILRRANIKSYPTDNYYDIRVLGYQILSADKGIASFYLENENPSMVGRIAESLKNVNKPCEDVDPGERLESLAIGLSNGISASFDIWYVAFEAQEITRAYCQSFNPDTETIDYIRSHYLVEDYEDVGIVAEEDAYRFIFISEEGYAYEKYF